MSVLGLRRDCHRACVAYSYVFCSPLFQRLIPAIVFPTHPLRSVHGLLMSQLPVFRHLNGRPTPTRTYISVTTSGRSRASPCVSSPFLPGRYLFLEQALANRYTQESVQEWSAGPARPSGQVQVDMRTAAQRVSGDLKRFFQVSPHAQYRSWSLKDTAISLVNFSILDGGVEVHRDFQSPTIRYNCMVHLSGLRLTLCHGTPLHAPRDERGISLVLCLVSLFQPFRCPGPT
ncbi:hypothetical protein HD554DRAFT_534816 [Boletus coccyginus]|nr:hypothetical protein HD554DRAFT_534816 [Boletus coccyginus]